MINMDLARQRGLSNSDIKDLEALHTTMRTLYTYWLVYRGWHWSKPRRKRFRRDIRRIEYLMQDAWGFDRDKHRHTHYKRFNGL